MENTFKYYSSGKFLLSGEYLVLDGAYSVGLPCKLGQHMEIVEEPGEGLIKWRSLTQDGTCWNSCVIKSGDFSILESSEESFALRLKQVLNACVDLGGKNLEASKDYLITTKLEFDPAWGLGSSSTFIANIASFFEVNPYSLLEKTFGGSGYDIAAAQAEGPYFYKIDGDDILVEPVDFYPAFNSNLFFVYLNEKQNSRSGIKSYKSVTKDKKPYLEKVSAISSSMIKASDIGTFMNLMDEHESLIAGLMDMQSVKNRLFSDFEGSVKSLGAWGGDFVLVCSENGSDYINQYFKEKGYQIVLPFDNIIKNKSNG